MYQANVIPHDVTKTHRDFVYHTFIGKWVFIAMCPKLTKAKTSSKCLVIKEIPNYFVACLVMPICLG